MTNPTPQPPFEVFYCGRLESVFETVEQIVRYPKELADRQIHDSAGQLWRVESGRRLNIGETIQENDDWQKIQGKWYKTTRAGFKVNNENEIYRRPAYLVPVPPPDQSTGTPETDAKAFDFQRDDGDPMYKKKPTGLFVHASFARSLERQRDEARKERDELADWKESAIHVEREWDANILATLLGAKFGESQRKGIAREVPKLLSEVQVLRSQLASVLADRESERATAIKVLSEKLAEQTKTDSALAEAQTKLASMSKLVSWARNDLGTVIKQAQDVQTKLNKAAELQ